MKANLANRPPIARVRALLAYESETGILRWRVTSGRAIEGREAGGVDKSTGYHRVAVDGILLMSHHVAFAIVEGYWPERLDHKFGKEAGNAWSNLRIATQSQNLGNIGLSRHNTSGLKGVSFHKATGKWQAQIREHGYSRSLGVFATKEEAHAAYMIAAEEHFGEFARGENFAVAVPVRPVVEKRSKSAKLTVDEVRDLLSYDSITGELRWKRALGFRGQVGSIAGRLNVDGYRRIGIFYKQYQAHVLAWVIMTGRWPTLIIHHKDANRSNNVWSNLEEITQAANVQAAYWRKAIYKPRTVA